MTIENCLQRIDSATAEKEKNKLEFNLQYQERIIDIQRKINRNIFHLLNLLEPEYGGTDQINSDSLQLIDRAIKLNANCLELVKRIDFVEATILTRSIIEFCSTAIALSKDAKIYNAFSSSKNFDSAKTISKAKEFIPELGKLWGEISNSIIHVNQKMHGVQKFVDATGGDRIELKIFHVTCLESIVPEDAEAILDHIELITYLILYTMEVVCFTKVEYRGIMVHAYPNKRTIVFGDTGQGSFAKLFTKIYAVK